MDSEQILQNAEAIAADSLAGLPEDQLLDRFCDRLVAAGVPLHRALIGVDTLHPVLDGRTFEWRDDRETVDATDYRRGDEATSPENWTASPFYHLWEARKPVLRRRLDDSYRIGEFPILDTLSRGGATDYLALLSFLGDDAQLGEIDCIYSSWATRHPDGYSDAQIAALERLLPCLAAVDPQRLRRLHLRHADAHLSGQGCRPSGCCAAISSAAQAENDPRGDLVQRPARLHPHRRHRTRRTRPWRF